MLKTERQMESNVDSPMANTLDRQQTRPRFEVSSSPFAGRIGGNQEFVVTSEDDDASEVLKKLPDAVSTLRHEAATQEYLTDGLQAPLISLRDALHPGGFLVLENYKLAILEGWGRFSLDQGDNDETDVCRYFSAHGVSGRHGVWSHGVRDLPVRFESLCCCCQCSRAGVGQEHPANHPHLL